MHSSNISAEKLNLKSLWQFISSVRCKISTQRLGENMPHKKDYVGKLSIDKKLGSLQPVFDLGTIMEHALKNLDDVLKVQNSAQSPKTMRVSNSWWRSTVLPTTNKNFNYSVAEGHNQLLRVQGKQLGSLIGKIYGLSLLQGEKGMPSFEKGKLNDEGAVSYASFIALIVRRIDPLIWWLFSLKLFGCISSHQMAALCTKRCKRIQMLKIGQQTNEKKIF